MSTSLILQSGCSTSNYRNQYQNWHALEKNSCSILHTLMWLFVKHSKGIDLIQGHLAKTAVLDLKTCQSVELPLLQKRKPTSHCKLCLMRILLSILSSCGITGRSCLYFVMLLYCTYASVFLPPYKSCFTLPHCHFSTTSVSQVACIKKCVSWASPSRSLSSGAGYGIGFHIL